MVRAGAVNCYMLQVACAVANTQVLVGKNQGLKSNYNCLKYCKSIVCKNVSNFYAIVCAVDEKYSKFMPVLRKFLDAFFA